MFKKISAKKRHIFPSQLLLLGEGGEKQHERCKGADISGCEPGTERAG
jgi:hypothetical protein